MATNGRGEGFCDAHLPVQRGGLTFVMGPIVIERKPVMVDRGYVPGNANAGFVADKYN